MDPELYDMEHPEYWESPPFDDAPPFDDYNAEETFKGIPVAIAIGRPGAALTFIADPTDGTILVARDSGDASYGSIGFAVRDFALAAELLVRAAQGTE